MTTSRRHMAEPGGAVTKQIDSRQRYSSSPRGRWTEITTKIFGVNRRRTDNSLMELINRITKGDGKF